MLESDFALSGDDDWWSQDEDEQRGIPPVEDLPQEDPFNWCSDAVIERFADAQRQALQRRRDAERRLLRARRMFFEEIRNRNVPPSGRGLARILSVLRDSADRPAATLGASAALTLSRIVVATGADRQHHIRELFAQLGGSDVASQRDRDLLEGALGLAHRLFDHGSSD